MALEPPPGWASDKLSEFLDTALRNAFFLFERHREVWKRLSAIDAAILKLGESRPRGFSAFFLLRSHSAFRASVRVGSSGQIPETYALLRTTLEWALYAAHVHENDERAEVWLRRHDGETPDGAPTAESEKARNRVRSEFTVRRLWEGLEQRSAPICNIAKELYDDSIDSGAHPNERALSSSMRPESEGTFQLDYFTPENSLALQAALRRICQVGVCCLEIFELLWPERFRLLGIDTELPQLRGGL